MPVVKKKASPRKTAKPAVKTIPLFNRECSWLDFNGRVLEVAADSKLPPLERLKFLAITASNLDEFAMVRVGALHVLQRSGRGRERNVSGETQSAVLEKVRERVCKFTDAQYKVYAELEVALEQRGIFRYGIGDPLSIAMQGVLTDIVNEELRAVITPMPFDMSETPLLKNLGNYLAVRLDVPKGENDLWLLPLWQTARFHRVECPVAAYAYIAVEDIVKRNLDAWFPGQKVLEASVFRVTRNADFAVRENELPDLMLGMEEVLVKRTTGFPIRVEVENVMSAAVLKRLLKRFDARNEDVIRVSSLVGLAALSKIAFMPGFDDLKEPSWEIQRPAGLPQDQSIFSAIAKSDQLLILPYESFDPVVRFVAEAADDPDVLAIKQILYRIGSESAIVDALIRAAERGKSVTVVVELKARFDEERNIDWARKLERYGVQVIYGIRNYKTHAKICMVVRREPQGVVRYMHFATGNYNVTTAKLYSDVGFFTCDSVMGEDATAFFNTICGVSVPMPMTKLAMSPLHIRELIYAILDRAIEAAASGKKVKLSAKINSLCDPDVIARLYEASQAGVKIRLNVRGICMLVPGLKGVSENIRVVSIVGKYLEHARIVHVQIAQESNLWISSADWMPRNLNRRIELMIPVEDRACRERLVAHLETFYKDNVNAWDLRSTGTWKRLTPSGKTAFRAQFENQEMIAETAKQESKRRPVTFEPHRKA